MGGVVGVDEGEVGGGGEADEEVVDLEEGVEGYWEGGEGKGGGGPEDGPGWDGVGVVSCWLDGRGRGEDMVRVEGWWEEGTDSCGGERTSDTKVADRVIRSIVHHERNIVVLVLFNLVCVS